MVRRGSTAIWPAFIAQQAALPLAGWAELFLQASHRWEGEAGEGREGGRRHRQQNTGRLSGDGATLLKAG